MYQHTCAFCGRTADEETVLAEGWVPYFWIGTVVEVHQAACLRCSTRVRLDPGTDEYVLIEDFEGYLWRYDFVQLLKTDSFYFIRQPADGLVRELPSYRQPCHVEHSNQYIHVEGQLRTKRFTRDADGTLRANVSIEVRCSADDLLNFEEVAKDCNQSLTEWLSRQAEEGIYGAYLRHKEAKST